MAIERKPFQGFTEKDFDAFLPEKQRDSEYNEERLEVKHKLHALGERASEPMARAGLDLSFKTSLSHPYTYNKYRVESQWVYFARNEKARRALKQLFGSELGKDLDMHYYHVILVAEISLKCVVLALKIHEQAWWDGQNIKNRCELAAERPRVAEELNRLNGFIMNIHDWRREYVCGQIHAEDVRNFFHYYTPGKHWLHLRMGLPRETVVGMGEGFASFAGDALAKLGPVYRLIEWRPDNDFVFAKRSGG
jgi:hypothetical protein